MATITFSSQDQKKFDAANSKSVFGRYFQVLDSPLKIEVVKILPKIKSQAVRPDLATFHHLGEINRSCQLLRVFR